MKKPIKMKNIILLISLLVLSIVSFGQTCGTVSNGPSSEFESAGKKSSINTPKVVRVFFHILKNSNGTAAFPATSLPSSCV